MINKLSFEIEHIKQISDRTRKDLILIEKMVYALGLLEILCLSNLSFIFKGGTSLILLLKIPKRFSTDIDILVKSEEEFDLILKNLNHYFPFKRYEEQHRQKNGSKLIKRHFKFYYESPIRKCESNILLDILIEKAHYLSLKTFDIINDFILMEGVPSQVLIPEIECILGYKLTAFAPKTTGILFGRSKSLEIIKQFYDIGALYESSEDYDLVIRTYESVVKEEMNYLLLRR
jgi:hypothetical protein